MDLLWILIKSNEFVDVALLFTRFREQPLINSAELRHSLELSLILEFKLRDWYRRARTCAYVYKQIQQIGFILLFKLSPSSFETELIKVLAIFVQAHPCILQCIRTGVEVTRARVRRIHRPFGFLKKRLINLEELTRDECGKSVQISTVRRARIKLFGRRDITQFCTRLPMWESLEFREEYLVCSKTSEALASFKYGFCRAHKSPKHRSIRELTEWKEEKP
ncbi:hypothetical protein LOAG_10842 [Loa loa]|uniref:Uncharacterized protein n=1 Tax=Loa loa TaxID=7209 RepID=A0A1S0TQL7_LOALO|nr:hypothetical protein LOAG_10842 [Loa loa]EFO17655.1 hypothetical protein LOAG_10842 [Loa loa]